jgi:signal peptidase II
MSGRTGVTRVLLIGLAVTAADQLSKFWIRARFAYGQSLPVWDGFFNLVYVRNTGAAWGMLNGQNLFLIGLALVILAALFFFRHKLLHGIPARRVVLGLLLGGILGNLIDRLRDGWVTDFLDFHVGPHHWPAFNVADAAICSAMAVYLISSLLNEHRIKKQKESADEAG